jgi:nicotinamidase-related amidase
MKSVAILGIDLQNDFVKKTGSLCVNGAEEDAKRIADFIRNNSDKINYLVFTLDSHRANHIAHASYWEDKNGQEPALFSTITAKDVHDGTWIPRIGRLSDAIHYLEELEKKGKKHTIWPPHCIIGTEGWALYKDISDALIEWELKNKRTPVQYEFKGSNWFTEHYSIFKAEVELPNYAETQVNHALLRTLNRFDEVILVGEARDFCVLNSLKDLTLEVPDLAKKVVVFEDCMSNVIQNNADADTFYQNSLNAGVRIMKSTEYKFIL